MDKLIERLLDYNKNNFIMKGKRVMVTDSGGVTRRIPYSDFFKLKVEKEGERYLLRMNDREGLDVMSFLLLGMCMSLSSLSVYESELKGGVSTSKYLVDLMEFVSKDTHLVSSLSDYVCISSNIDEIFVNTSQSLQTVKKHASEEEFKSLYFTPYFGSSLFRPNIGIISDIMPYLTCLSVTEEGRKKLIEAFCYFSPIIALGGAQVFGGSKVLQDMDSSDSLGVLAASTYLNGDRFLKFRYEKFRLSDSLDVTDIEGISFLLAFYFAGSLSFGNDEAEFLRANTEIFSTNFDALVGNDYVRSYLLDGNINSLLSIPFRDKSVDYAYEGNSYSIPMVSIYNCSKFFSDLKTLDLDVERLEGSSSLCADFVSYKDCYYCLIKSGGTRMLLNYINEVSSMKKDFNSKVKYYKDRNSELSGKNKELTSTVKSLNSEVENLKSYSTSVREEDYIELQKKLALMQGKVTTLEEKCVKLESRCKESEKDMSDLLTSLECEDEEDTSTSIEDMIEFLNGFNLCFIGGRNDMSDKLHEMGLHNFSQLTCGSDVSRLNNFDFMVSMTRFMSHKLFYGALGKLGSERDKHHYFNGTNLNSLICSCYEFINRYFEIS